MSASDGAMAGSGGPTSASGGPTSAGSGEPRSASGEPRSASGRPFRSVNLISDPIHGYIELTKRLPPDRATGAGLPREEVAEEDVLDTAWLQRLRRISQLQSARWVYPTAEHSRFTHGLGVMHEAGLWARQLYPTLRSTLATPGRDDGGSSGGPGVPSERRGFPSDERRVPSEGLVVETLRIAGLLHDVGHGPFAHFFDDHVLGAFPAPADARRSGGKRLTHEDLSQLIIERELGDLIRGLRRAPGASPERDAFADDEAIDPRWVSFLVSKPALDDPSMPPWVRWLQPLLSGVFTVDNLDYVRRDAYMTGVAIGPVDVERLRRYSFIGPAGLTLYESGVGALEMFLTARLFLYRNVYFHRTVRAIDLDLAEVFAPSVHAIAGDGSPADDLSAYADLDEYALLHQAAMWARGEALSSAPRPGDGRVAPAIGELWRGILLRRPRWRSEAEVRVEFDAGAWPETEIASLGAREPGRIEIDLAVVDARPGTEGAAATDVPAAGTDGPAAATSPTTAMMGATVGSLGSTGTSRSGPVAPAAGVTAAPLAIETRDGRPASLARALSALPAYALIGRRYRRTPG
jgi:HD superfamily phosphohydrolase